MNLQNQNKGTTPLLVRFSGQPNPVAQNDDLKAPKIRKPYTITKQREKWSDEEHHKFVEALKLYGRAWRQIEEFIGTKTAVQIRSHAQKFFSKVVRGGHDSTESPVQAIEIPPPRPKRKPAHPYPRKFVEPQNNISPSFQPEKRLCAQIVAPDTEIPSRNSAAMTHVLEFPVSELPDSCVSTSSCSNGMESGRLFSVDKEDNSKAISSFPYKENENVPAIDRFASSKVHNPVSKGTMLFEKEADLPEATIMLFGKIVYTKDSKRASADTKDTFKPSGHHLTIDNDDKHGEIKESPASNGLDTPPSRGLYYGNWMPWGLHELSSDSREASTHVSMEWMPLPLYSGTLPLYLMPCRQSTAGPLRDDGKEPYISRMKSVSTHFSIGGDAGAVSPNHNHKSGFVPYRRCSGTESIKSAKTVAEEDDGQRVQLCL